MTIRKRLILSHISMCILPFILTFFVLVSGVCGLLLYAKSGNHIIAESSFQFSLVSNSVKNILLHNVRREKPFDSYGWILDMMDPVHTFVLLESNGKSLYRYGNESFLRDLDNEEAEALVADLQRRSDGSYSITGPDRYMYMAHQTVRGVPYNVYILAHQPVRGSDAAIEHAIRYTAWFVLGSLGLFIIFVSRFLSRFIIGSIARPLQALQKGAEEIRKGNLDITLDDTKADEFTPVMKAFNTMSEKLSLSLAEREADEKSRKELIASISHDIRTPLTSIKAYVEGLQDHVADTPEKQERYLQVIRKKTDVLDSMVEQLFLMAKLDLGEKAVPLERLSLTAVLKDTAEENRLAWEKGGAVLTVETEGELPVRGSRLLLMRITENLVSNSIKYKTEETVHIRIRAEAERGQAVLTVTDDGPGVPAEALGRLQEAFYRTDKARSRTENGSGLGLSIVSRGVSLMKGTVTFDHHEPHGLTVRIVIPLEEVK